LAELLDAGHPQQAAPLPVESRVEIIVIQLPRTNTLVANSGGSAGKDQKQLNRNTPNHQF
jgi:hypothetical protein